MKLKIVMIAVRNSLPSEVYNAVTHMGGRHDHMAKTKAMDDLPGRVSSGQISIRTKDNGYIRESADFAATLK